MMFRPAICATLLTLPLLAGGCDAEEAGALEDSFRNQDSGLEGKYIKRIADMYDGSAVVSHHIRIGEGSDEVTYQLDLEEDPEFEPGSRIRVVGDPDEAGHVAVDQLTMLAPPPTPLIDPEKRDPRKIAFVMVEFGGRSALSREVADAKVFVGNKSTSAYYGEISYGMETLHGDVFGPYEIPEPGGCAQDSIASQARAAMEADGVRLTDYIQYMYYFPGISGCGWSGLAAVGAPTAPARDSWYNGSSGCVVLAQEIGHNYGMAHSRSYSCTLNEERVPFSDECDFNEYGDPFDPMGGGCAHMNVFQKGFMGWLQSCNTVTATSDGRFNLVPTELPCNGTQALRIPIGNRYYYLEYRRAEGSFDGLNAVLVHEAPGYRGPGRDPYILDMVPETGSHRDGVMLAGDEYTDFEGRVTFRVVELLETHAVIELVFPDGGDGVDPVCDDGSAPVMEADAVGTLECADEAFPADITAPEIQIVDPMDEAVLESGTDFTLVADATDDRGVAKVELYVNGEFLGNDWDEPYEWDLVNVPDGRYGFQAVADDGVHWVPSEITWVNIGQDQPPGDSEGDSGEDSDGDSSGSDSDSSGETGDSAGTDGGDSDGGDTEGGSGGQDSEKGDGCSCSSTGGTPWSTLALGGLVLGLRVSRRRRR